jgi:hypothetical protein
MPSVASKTGPMRLNQKAQLVPIVDWARWHTIASTTPGLSKLEVALLDGLASYFHQLEERGYAGKLSVERIALDLETAPRLVRETISSLIGKALLGVMPGAGQRANEFYPALPYPRGWLRRGDGRRRPAVVGRCCDQAFPPSPHQPAHRGPLHQPL